MSTRRIMSTEEDPVEGCIATVLSFLVSPFTIALNGYALSVLWGWFMVPLALPAIGKATPSASRSSSRC